MRSETDSTRVDIKSRVVEIALRGWIEAAAFLTIGAAFIILVYALVRPWFTSTLAPIESQASIGATMLRWPVLLGNTLLIAGLAIVICLAVALPLSYVLFRTDLPGYSLMTMGLVPLICLPLFVASSGILSVFGLHTAFGHVWMVGLIHAWVGIPLALFQLGLGYRSVDRDLEEAAWTEASRWKVWWHVDWPQIRWSVLFVALLQLWLASTEVTVSNIVSVRTFAEEVFMSYQLSGSAVMESLVIAPFLALVVLMVVSVQRAARRSDLRLTRMLRAAPKRISVRRARRTLAVVVAVVVATLVILPMSSLAGKLGGASNSLTLALRMTSELRQSLELGATVSICTVLVVMGISARVVATNSIGRFLRGSLVFLFALPSPFIAIALIEMLNRPGPLGRLYDSPGALVIGQTLRWLPLAVVLTVPALLALSREALDAARIDGCNQVRLHTTLYWPTARPFLVFAGIVTFILVLGEVTICVLLSPPGFLPLSVRFFTLVHYGLQNEAATICWMVIIVLLLPWSSLVFVGLSGARISTMKSHAFAWLLPLLLVIACRPGGDTGRPSVVVYTALDRSFAEPILDKFEQSTGIKVLPVYDTESTKSVGLVNRIRAERNRPRCDVFWNNEVINTIRLNNEKLLRPVHPANADQYPATMRDADGRWYGFAARARILLVNTERVAPEATPHSMYDLLKPQWKGLVGIAKPVAGTTATHVACLFQVLGVEKAQDYFRQLLAADVKILDGNKSCAMAVASGDLVMAWTDTDDAIIEVEDHQPVTIVYPDSGPGELGTLFLPNTLAAVKGSPHTLEADRLIAFLLAQSVEEQLAAGPSAQIPLNRRAKSPGRIRGPNEIQAMPVDFREASRLWDTAQKFIRTEFLR